MNAAATARLVYVVGPSGAGKDSLLGWLAQRLEPGAGVAFARRSITRAATSDGEQHDSLGHDDFVRLRDAGAFGLHWQANGLCYGVRHAELPPRSDAACVIVNGSRAYVGEAAVRYPGLTVVHVTAGIDTLRRRLLARGREDADAVDARVRRALDFRLPHGLAAVEIHNDGTLAEAGEQLLQALGLGPGLRASG